MTIVQQKGFPDYKGANYVSIINGKIKKYMVTMFYQIGNRIIFPPSSHPTVVFLSCRPFVVNTFSTPTRPVENVILTTKGLQERNTQLLDGTTVEK